MPNCLVIQHVVPESAFAIETLLRGAGGEIDTRRVFAGDAIPHDLTGIDGLVVLGGPMSARSDEGFSTRGAEIALLAEAIDAGIPTLGVCLGAQLLALAGGGLVASGAAGPEVGWHPVTLLASCDDDALFTGLPETLTVLHWHSDTFEIPSGAHLLMANTSYANQAFRVGEVAWGLQFHLEVTEEAVEGFLRAFSTDAAGAPGGSDRIRTATSLALEELTAPRNLVLGRFAGLVAAQINRADLVGGA
jgi:GMP synthase-like glutamine amidotransferase